MKKILLTTAALAVTSSAFGFNADQTYVKGNAGVVDVYNVFIEIFSR